MTRVEHTSHYLLIDAEPASECQPGQSTVPKREGKSGLRSSSGWDSDMVLPGTAGARQRYGFVVVKAAGDGFVQRVGRLGECVRFVDATGETLGQIPKRDDNLGSTGAAQLGRINETHEVLPNRPVPSPSSKCDVEAIVALRPRAGRIDAARLRRENHVTSLMSNVIDRNVTLPLHEQGGVEVPDATDDVDLVTRDGWPFHNRAPVQPHLPPGRPDP